MSLLAISREEASISIEENRFGRPVSASLPLRLLYVKLFWKIHEMYIKDFKYSILLCFLEKMKENIEKGV